MLRFSFTAAIAICSFWSRIARILAMCARISATFASPLSLTWTRPLVPRAEKDATCFFPFSRAVSPCVSSPLRVSTSWACAFASFSWAMRFSCSRRLTMSLAMSMLSRAGRYTPSGAVSFILAAVLTAGMEETWMTLFWMPCASVEMSKSGWHFQLVPSTTNLIWWSPIGSSMMISKSSSFVRVIWCRDLNFDHEPVTSTVLSVSFFSFLNRIRVKAVPVFACGAPGRVCPLLGAAIGVAIAMERGDAPPRRCSHCGELE
mmetsp:Transcript_43841/g.103218  ORF Transcript_43841/g.103218 Transcript_43841/m.103218 type:complete len:260 (-) Transcript_43841:216-995(-)